MSRTRPWSLGFDLFSASSLFSVTGFPVLLPGTSYFCVFTYLSALRLHLCLLKTYACFEAQGEPHFPQNVCAWFPPAGRVLSSEGGRWILEPGRLAVPTS